MAGTGSPAAHDASAVPLDGTGLRIAIVHGQWHPIIAQGLLDGARRYLATTGATVTEIAAPGAFELPVLARTALETGADGVVALGVILRGGTPHFEFVAQAATVGLTHAALETGRPVGFGVLTIDTEQQGIDRAGLPGSREDKGAEAAHATVAAALALRGMRG